MPLRPSLPRQKRHRVSLDPDSVEWLNERQPQHTHTAVYNGKGVWVTEDEYYALLEAGATPAPSATGEKK